MIFGPKGSEVLHRRIGALEARGGRVHNFQARDLRSADDIFRVFADEFRFPHYFGCDWDAMVDCLDDLCLEVTGGVGVVGVIHEAESPAILQRFVFLVFFGRWIIDECGRSSVENALAVITSRW